MKIGILVQFLPAARHGEGAAVSVGEAQLCTPAPAPASTELS